MSERVDRRTAAAILQVHENSLDAYAKDPKNGITVFKDGNKNFYLKTELLLFIARRDSSVAGIERVGKLLDAHAENLRIVQEQIDHSEAELEVEKQNLVDDLLMVIAEVDGAQMRMLEVSRETWEVQSERLKTVRKKFFEGIERFLNRRAVHG